MKLNWLPAVYRPTLSPRLALRLALLAPLVGGVASAQSMCQANGGTLEITNLVTNESRGTFGTLGAFYRDLEPANRPGAPYQFSSTTQFDSFGRPGVLVLNQKYTVTSTFGSGARLNSYGPWQAYPGHTTGSADDAYLAVNGAVSQATFLRQPVTLKPNTTYEVGLWGRSPHAANSIYGGPGGSAQLAITVDGLATGTTTDLLRGEDWERGSVIFNSGNTTSSTVFYKNISTADEGNDFYVDDVYLQECVLPSGSMTGTVYQDSNANGVQDNGEPGIAGVTMKETDRNGSTSTVVTDSNGRYTFSNLPVLNNAYRTDVVASSAPLQGLIATTPTSTTGVNVVANSTVPGGNYGYKPPNTQTDLAVYKYVDLNHPDFPSRDPAISQYYRGDTVAYYYEAFNNGPNAADGAKLVDAPRQAGQLSYLTWTCTASGGAQCPAASGTGAPNLTLPKFPSGGKVVVRYFAVVNVIVSQLYNTVTITPPVTVIDTNPANNSDTVYICAHLIPDLTLTKTSNGPWTVLQPGATYTLTVTNKGTASTGGALITVEDLLPVGIGAAFPSGFSPAPGWTCTYQGEAEQGKGVGLNPFEAQRVLCTSSVSIAVNGVVNLTLPVNVTPNATATVFNRASVGKSNDPDPRPKAELCNKTSYPCAVDTTTVSPRPLPPVATCPVGTPVNLLASPLEAYVFLDNVTSETPATLIANAAAYTVPTTGSFIVDGSYFFNNGVALNNAASLPSTLQLVINGTVYATFLTEAGYSGRASVTAQNGATLVGGTATTALQLNRTSTTNIWVQLPASVTSITDAKVIFKSTSPGTEASDDYSFSVKSIYGCFAPNPKATVTKTAQNITANGPVGITGTGKPGEVLEYCITTTNTGNIGLGKLGFGDNVPANTAFKLGAYGAGRDIRVTYPAPLAEAFLTAAADADLGVLAAGRVTVNPSNFVLAPGKAYTVCFRATIG
ncbi:SdrD B-like domain-containing protein [Deinococcus puniceus]|uniref:SdrD B-like domain-containing protein n=1 Tax=Deinococcus puniceus TaxID=1182568 RepID=UPI0007C9281D|nr:SdrD B-like domain-containing protein [Deinococcus puniceus]